MFRPLEFDPDTEALVRFVEETPADRMVPDTLAKLRDGLPARDLARASVLAVARSTELPAGHHGGVVHPINGLKGCLGTAERLTGEIRFLPSIQHAALCNHHIQSPHMGPYIMPALEPRDGSIDTDYQVFRDSESSVVHMGRVDRSMPDDGRLDATVTALLNNIENWRPVPAEQCLLWLLRNQSPGEVLDHILPLCIARNHKDDHNFLYPVFTAMALQEIGWDWASVLFRPVIRYHARETIDISEDPDFQAGRIEDAMREFGLEGRRIPTATNETETDAVVALADTIGRNRNLADNIEPVARALAGGLSLEGAVEALSVGASRIFVCSTYANPMDSHLHTAVATRRFLIHLPGVCQRSRMMALLSGLTGPECTCSGPLMTDGLEPTHPVPVSSDGEDALLAALVDCIESRPKVDWRSIVRVDQVALPDAARDAIALARRYVDRGHDVGRLFDRLGELVARDDFTELHGIKQHQTIVDEYRATRPALRDIHVLAAAKSTACVRVGKEQSVYDELKPLLH